MTYRFNLSKLTKGLNLSPFIFIVDTETTGFSPKMHDMITLSAEVRDIETFDLKDEIDLFVKPKHRERWSVHAEKVHGYSWEDAQQFNNPYSEAIKLLHFLKPFKHEHNMPLLFVAHDLNQFDYKFMKSYMNNQGLINSFFKVFNQESTVSTIDLGRKMNYAENGLDAWAPRVDFDLQHHNATSDRKCGSKVFKFQLENANELDFDFEKRSRF